MLISELSKRTGISTHTIRFYEKSGLIKGKRNDSVKSNNYFHYGEDAVEKLELIRDAKAVGFTISEIAKLIETWYGKRMSVTQKVNVLDLKLKAIDERITQLKMMKRMISGFKKDVLNGDC